jgi:hypothetical protein
VAQRRLVARQVAAISAGKAATYEATPVNLLTALKTTTRSRNQVILLDRFKGATPHSVKINIVIEKELERLVGGPISAPQAGVAGFFTSKGHAYSARLKRLMENSGWVLFDADTPKTMPRKWARLSLVQRLELFEDVLPGISRCLRITYRGSSARVINGSGNQTPEPTHALIQISHPALLDRLRKYVQLQSAIKGLSFPSPKHSKTDPNKVTGVEWLTLFDTVTIGLGRLVINAEPDVTKAPGYNAISANPTIVNPGGGVLDVGWIEPPTAEDHAAYNAATGKNIRLDSADASGVTSREDGVLQIDTEIEHRGVIKSLGEWLVEMLDHDQVKMRIEAPFRESHSEAAVLRIGGDDNVFIYDSGASTSTYLPTLPRSAVEADLLTLGATPEAQAMMLAVMEAWSRRRTRQIQTGFMQLPIYRNKERT